MDVRLKGVRASRVRLKRKDVRDGFTDLVNDEMRSAQNICAWLASHHQKRRKVFFEVEEHVDRFIRH